MPDSTVNLIIYAEISVAVLALVALARRWLAVRQFARDIPTDSVFPLADEGIFRGRTDIADCGNQFVSRMRLADLSKRLDQFDFHSNVQSLQMALRSSSAIARSASGLFIIGGLIITLFNLQGAVFGLGQTFEQLSRTGIAAGASQDMDVVKRVQDAMGSVAYTASAAFKLSGGAICCAFVLMFAAAVIDRMTGKTWMRFDHWAHGVAASRLQEHRIAVQGEPQPDFTETVRQFRHLVDSLDAATKELASLGDFQESLNVATAAIGEAVNRLPEAIQANMSSLSSQVTREISEDLKHQYEILQKLLVTYGDIGLSVQSVERFTSDLLNQQRQNTESLAKLSALPTDIVNLATVNHNLAGKVESLDKTTKAIKALEFEATKKTLESLSERMSGIQESIRGLSARDEELVRQFGNEVKARLVEFKVGMSSDYSKGVSQVLAKVDALKVDLGDDGLREQIESLAEQLKELQNSRLLRILGGVGRAASAG